MTKAQSKPRAKTASGIPGPEQKSLAQALSINAASAMSVVNRLEAAGYVRREPGHDRRSKSLRLTDAGETAFQQELAIESGLTGELLSFAAPEEIDRLAAMLDSIRQHAESIASAKAD